MTKLLDNRSQGRVGEELWSRITDGSRLSILTRAFSICAYLELESRLKRIGELRLLLSHNDQPTSRSNDTRCSVPGLVGGEGDRRFRNSLQLTYVARACAGWQVASSLSC